MSVLFDWRRAAALSFLALPLGIQAERRFRALPKLAVSASPARLPSLSIIVPARNERENLARLLPSLNAVVYPGPCEVIVVDDGSTDGTAEVARMFGARVLRVDSLPRGWLGKPHACHTGARSARGEWLLFTDADTIHPPDGPSQAVSHALENGLDVLSAFIAQDCSGLLDRLALLTSFVGLFAGDARTSRLLNGQYILIRREVYFESGGFEAVRGEPLEDLAFGTRLRKQGYRVEMARGEEVAHVRMYKDNAQVWHGMQRMGSGSLKWIGVGGLVTALFVTSVMSPFLVLLGVLLGRLDRRWLIATWSAATLSVLPSARHFGSPALAALAPLGALFVWLASCLGVMGRIFGKNFSWKGRRV